VLFKGHTFHQHIIYISLNDPTQLMLKHFVNHPLVCGPYILQNKRHDSIAVGPSLGYKGCLFFINWMHRDLKIPGVCIQKATKLVPVVKSTSLSILGSG